MTCVPACADSRRFGGGHVQDVTRTPEGTRIVPIFKGIQRDMPISYEHQMENLCDPVRPSTLLLGQQCFPLACLFPLKE